VPLVAPLVAYVVVYFVLNSGFTAIAIGLDTRQSPSEVWRRNFRWLWIGYLGSASIAFCLVLLLQQHSLAASAMVLPLFADADPIEFPIQRAEIDLQTDFDGGYTAKVRGMIDPDIALHQAALGTYQMLRSNPHDHVGLAEILTRDIFTNAAPIDVTVANLETASALKSLLAPDQMVDGQRFLSIGIGFHLVPCDEGTCAATTVIDHCDDRVQDADETDVDCGGSCHACGYDTKCVVATDCQTGACDSGMCRAPTCTDGIKDGFETGVDCGAYGCPACPNN